MQKNPESTRFGTRNVRPSEKTGLVHDVFGSVAKRYDIMNDLMSGGIHRRWKNHLVRKIRPRPRLHYLDVAGGTGDIAFRIRDKTGPAAQITLCDLTEDMLKVGRDRAVNKGWLDLNWITGNAESLPLPDQSVDIYTIAFGLRNVTHIDTALSEAHRVLKPGGRFYCLEFSHVDDPVLAQLYDRYSHFVIPKLGEWVTKDAASYDYLVESIRAHPDQESLKARIEMAGFGRCRYENLTFGVAAIHEGVATDHFTKRQLAEHS